MDWLAHLLTDVSSVPHIILVYSLVIAVGALLGRIRLFGVSLGVTFVLFAAIAAGHFGFTVNPAVLYFLRDFGLTVFIYFIGLQVGPSFFSSFKSGGMVLNLLTVLQVLLGVAVTIALYILFRDTLSLPQMLGVHYGAVTNTPGLGATQETLELFKYTGENIAVAYACAYPLGVIGTIGSAILIRFIFRIKLAEEDKAWDAEERAHHQEPVFFHVEVSNRALEGRTIEQVRNFISRGFIPNRQQPMRITLRQLSVFRSLYETHRVSASAARLHLSPSAVSQSLKELESALGARLFVRESKGLTPTPAALTLLPYATLLVDKADEVEALFAEAGEGRAGTLAVGANRRFGIYVLSRRLMHMKRRMPAIETSLMIEDNDVVEDAVAGHLIDVGFISGRPTNPDLDGFPCFEDRFAFVVGLGSPLMSAYVTARELSDATWVLEREQRTQREVLAHLEARGIRIRHSVTMDTMGAVKRAAGTGLGVALLPYLSVREEILRGDLVEIMKPASTELADSQKIWAVWRRDAEGALRSAFFQACSIEPIA